MKYAFRWYNGQDDITLRDIKQIPNVEYIVTALYDIPVGEVWELDKIIELKKEIENAGLKWEVVESVPVSENIKLRRGNYQKEIQNYKQTLKNLSYCGIKCVCYNFMPVFDWTRTDLNYELEDGSTSLAYDHEKLLSKDIFDLELPGWDISYQKEEILNLIEEYKELGKDGLWENLTYFIKEIIPVAIKYDIKMAIHPDDPCWSVFELPRIISTEDDLDRLLKIYDDPHNGLALCSGSLGCNPKNNIVKLVKKYSFLNKINFAHIRNIKILGDKAFCECSHVTNKGDLDIVEIVKAYVYNDFEGYIRADHGRNIWNENGRPGYGLYDRALGIVYIQGIVDAIKGE